MKLTIYDFKTYKEIVNNIDTLYMDNKLEKYLKERNIPTDSLEANSIREGVNWAIEQTIEFFKEELIDARDGFGYQLVSTFDSYTLDEFIETFKKSLK